MDEIIRFSVSLPNKLLQSLDEKIIHKGYASRSEFIRDLIREQINADRWQDESGEVFGNLTLIYDHHQRELAAKMIDIQHHNTVAILCSTHVHLDHHNCLESIIMKGTPQEVERIATELGGLKGVQFAKLVRASSFEP